MKRRLLVLLVPFLALLALPGPARASDDPGFSKQWGLAQIGAPNAWSRTTGTGVTVGIVDSGAFIHPDFAGRVKTVDCTDSGGSDANCRAGGADQNGHGTHVTGIVAAEKDNRTGVAGVAPRANVVVAKVFKCNNSACDNPSATSEDIVAGVNKVLNMGAKVINLSLGDAGLLAGGILCDNSGFGPLLNQIWNAGAVPVFAAGNCGSGFLGGGANFSDVKALIVGATGPSGNKAGYSNSLSTAKWGLVAPGGGDNDCAADQANCILSTWLPEPGTGATQYAYLRGTSMAAPHVAGAVADLLQLTDRDTAVNALLANLDPVSCGTDCKGRLNLAKAVASIPGGSSSASSTAPPAGGKSTPTTAKKKSGGGSTGTTSGGSSSGGTTTIAAEETTTTAPSGDASTVNDEELQSAQSGEANPGRAPEEDGASGPLKVAAALGVLGTAGMAAPIAWRRFLKPG